jgi:hypothetical protein
VDTFTIHPGGIVWCESSRDPGVERMLTSTGGAELHDVLGLHLFKSDDVMLVAAIVLRVSHGYPPAVSVLARDGVTWTTAPPAVMSGFLMWLARLVMPPDVLARIGRATMIDTAPGDG